MSGRLLTIGDIHGYTAALDAVVTAADIQPEDTLVALGDYIDRGPDSKGTIQYLIDLSKRCRLIPILGNHDQMALAMGVMGPGAMDDWLKFGGDATLRSYGCKSPGDFPVEHIDFLAECLDYYETEKYFFVHASYQEDLPLAEQTPDILRWDTLRRRVPGPHCSGKTAIVGHTAQPDGEIVDIGHLICIDTWIYGEGRLTLMDVNSRELWQADKTGKLRGK
ncbi:MAG: serine/threonine protein phosphatase [Pirellulales bacterium]|nr:serine/threonine protein phosphatase [Pirellulales bacterium]